MFDQWVAGFGHGVLGGITTAIRREDYGEIQEGDHAFLWNMGNLAGVSSAFVLNFVQPAAFTAQIGGVRWAGAFRTGLDTVAGGFGGIQSVRGLADGDWNYTDVFNLLGLVTFAVPAITSAKKSLGTFRRIRRTVGFFLLSLPPTYDLLGTVIRLKSLSNFFDGFFRNFLEFILGVLTPFLRFFLSDVGEIPTFFRRLSSEFSRDRRRMSIETTSNLRLRTFFLSEEFIDLNTL